MTAHGKFHWNELMTRDVAKAKNFYAESLGWTYDDVPMGEMYGTYTIIKSGDEMAGGMSKMDGPMFEGRPESWFTYVAVDDLDDRLRKAREAGGTVMREPWDVPGIGRIAIVADTGGAVQGGGWSRRKAGCNRFRLECRARSGPPHARERQVDAPARGLAGVKNGASPRPSAAW
jgi:predicted enzyme related to lactoylglutathione lyase